MLNGYQFWKVYHAVHLHFTSKYDVIKYGFEGRNFNVDIYNKRRDKSRFESYAGKLNNTNEAYELCVANFVHNSDGWIYEDFKSAHSIYSEWKRYFDGFDYRFKEEFKTLKKIQDDHKLKFKDMLVNTAHGNKPPLLQLLLHNKFTPEFICILDKHFNFIDKWFEMYKNIDPFIETKLQKLTRYKPLCIILSKE